MVIYIYLCVFYGNFYGLFSADTHKHGSIFVNLIFSRRGVLLLIFSYCLMTTIFNYMPRIVRYEHNTTRKNQWHQCVHRRHHFEWCESFSMEHFQFGCWFNASIKISSVLLLFIMVLLYCENSLAVRRIANDILCGKVFRWSTFNI